MTRESHIREARGAQLIELLASVASSLRLDYAETEDAVIVETAMAELDRLAKVNTELTRERPGP